MGIGKPEACARWVLISLIMVLFTPLIAPARALTAEQTVPRFGIIGPAQLAVFDQLGAGWMQLPFSWAMLQPDSADDWRADAVDTDLIAAVVNSGREVVGLISDTPAWASWSGQSVAVPDGLALPVDDPGNAWAAFVRRLVVEYADVQHWIIYDEPNVQIGEGRVRFGGDVDDYARLLRAAYLAAKTANPDAVIHTAALNGWVDAAAGRDPYLARLLRVLKADPDAAAHRYYFDVVTVRVVTYLPSAGRELDNVRAMLEAATGGPRPVWLEVDALPDRAGGVTALTITPAQAADFVVQAAALGLAAGVERIAFAGLHPPRGGGFWPPSVMHDLERLPAFNACRTVITLFTPAQRVTRHAHAAAELVVLDSAAQTVYVMWAVGEWPLLFSITSNAENEAATLITPHDSPAAIASRVIDWPAVFRVEVPPARRDANGFLTVAGSPVLLVLAQDDAFVRVTTMQVNGTWVRLR